MPITIIQLPWSWCRRRHFVKPKTRTLLNHYDYPLEFDYPLDRTTSAFFKIQYVYKIYKKNKINCLPTHVLEKNQSEPHNYFCQALPSQKIDPQSCFELNKDKTRGPSSPCPMCFRVKQPRKVVTWWMQANMQNLDRPRIREFFLLTHEQFSFIFQTVWAGEIKRG